MSTIYTGTYKPSGFATAAHRGKFRVAQTDGLSDIEQAMAYDADPRWVKIDDGGQFPSIGSRAWLVDPTGGTTRVGRVIAAEGHCTGFVTVSVKF